MAQFKAYAIVLDNLFERMAISGREAVLYTMPDFRKHWTTSFFSIVRMLLSMVLAGWVSVGYGVQRKETEEVNMTIWIAQLPEDFSIESKDGRGVSSIQNTG